MSGMTSTREQANREAFRRMCESEPVLVDVLPAIDAIPGMTAETILTSGPRLEWGDYVGGQREAIIGGAIFEGLARDREDADKKLREGRIRIDGCQAYNAVGSVAGIYTASMPVFAVRNARFGNVGYCNFYEGTNPRRLNYGVYDDGVRDRLRYVNGTVAPILAEAVRRSGGIPLKPIMRRALHMGDELHSRCTAASLMFARELFPHFLAVAETSRDGVEKTIEALTADNYFFLRLSMAAAKATADAAHNIKHSSIVTAMAISCREFAIRVSGLGERWFCGPHPAVEAKLFEGHTQDEITWMGGESIIAETIGLGGFAQAAAFPLQTYQGGSPAAMVERNLELYRITAGENTDFHIPFLSYRGTPTGIDVFKVLETGITPVMDVGIPGRDGGQIGAGIVRAPIECFKRAADAFHSV
ncbi:MAG TPA: DUF1116 domain-containing protein [Alphaproteobacteria bacterium]|nr:DUF1116 domain-containing protein [Alphaproteobacteria bacterium]